MQNIQQLIQTYKNSINIPRELTVKPLALIGFSGLDTRNNAVHKSIWETFKNRGEKAPILYKLIKNDHEFPVTKPQRNSYDWYIPKGIWKRNWIAKHLYEIPSIIVIFYDLDWKDGQWNEKLIECASRVQSLRAALAERATKIVVVLIQNYLPVPEDPLAGERAVSLCSSCELNANCLYVLPHGQHQLGYTIRLENVFYEFAQNYYHNEMKSVKTHKEHLNKSVHQSLFVRHQFKMGFLSELKQDVHSAHKHYTHAYNNLLDIRIVDTNALEIRTIAGFINYKICRIMFMLNLPRDAISQFKKHIDKFHNRSGFQELTFEHYAWLAKQHEIFGDIFDEAVKLGLPAVQIQHPGIYYKQAAQYAILRKKSCEELCASIIAYPYPDPLEGMDRIEFYGQYPWRPGKMSSEPPDPQIESNGIQALQYLERQINHSALIIALYGMAIAQYKTYKCPRTRRHLVLQMADECYMAKDYGKALTLLTHMLTDYREEKWWKIISEILEKAIRCAYLAANIQDYIQFAFEMLNSNIVVKLDDKKRIYEDLNRILKKQIPFGDPKLPHDILQNAIILWQPAFQNDALIEFSLDMSQVYSCIEIKARFIKNTYYVDQNVTVEVFVRSSCPFPLVFNKVSVLINTQNLTSEFALSSDDSKQLSAVTFNSNETKRFLVEFQANLKDINKEIQIDSINLVLGNNKDSLITLKYNCASTLNNSSSSEYFYRYNTKSSELIFDDVKPLITALIVPRESKLLVQFQHLQPALLGEWYHIGINIVNKELSAIKGLNVVCKLLDEDINDVEFSTAINGRVKPLPISLQIQSNLDVDNEISTELFMRPHKIGQKNVHIKIMYTLDTANAVVSVKNDIVPLPIVHPFEVGTRFVSLMMEPIQKFYVNERFGVMPTIRCLSPYAVVIDSTHFEFLSPVKAVEDNPPGIVTNKLMNNEEIIAELYLAVCERSSEQNVNLGQYSIKWRRENGPINTTIIPISGYHCVWLPLKLSVTTPGHGYVRTPLTITYDLTNQSSHLIQLVIGLEANEAFMFFNYRKSIVSLLPHSVKTLSYSLYPLLTGNVSFPKLTLDIPENVSDSPYLRMDQLQMLIARCLPPYLYIMPQIKGKAEVPDIVKTIKCLNVN